MEFVPFSLFVFQSAVPSNIPKQHKKIHWQGSFYYSLDGYGTLRKIKQKSGVNPSKQK